ncbi:MAG: NUDIX hydrolase [Clostridia bacterium]|nr:NUDIX hydrolase [Clostridia bacterium]
MWTGGVRVIVLDEENRILMVKHVHPERTVWMAPGGGIEEGESSAQAAVREVWEETGLEVEITGLVWHVEEVSERGQRFVNFFRARVTGGELKLGRDPELTESGQVLADIRFMHREEVADLENLYPEFLRHELWQHLEQGTIDYNAFRMRDE